MTLTANVTNEADDQISEARERVSYHKAKAKFWRSSANEDGDPHGVKLASDHERFHQAWLKELEFLERNAHR